MKYNPITAEGRMTILKGYLSSNSVFKVFKDLKIKCEFFYCENLKGYDDYHVDKI
jgi:hypothetical protein